MCVLITVFCLKYTIKQNKFNHYLRFVENNYLHFFIRETIFESKSKFKVTDIMIENQQLDKKSLRAITKNNPDWDELAKDCIAFANAYGGRILIGIEDDAEFPEPSQRIQDGLISKLQKQIQGKTLNVNILPQKCIAENGGEYIDIVVQRTASTIASTSNGRYYIRVEDDCKPILPDELGRLLVDKNAFVWETQQAQKIHWQDYDAQKFADFRRDVLQSERISIFIKEKNDRELLEYYLFVIGDYLTNLGILWIGQRTYRACLLYAPSVQFIKYDEQEQKVKKQVWDDYTLNPKELIQAIWSQIADFQEGLEFPDGIYRKTIPNYDETVIRELLANAIVHRPYTIRGDIFLNLFIDRLEVHNPGLLPLGVSPQNILHQSVQRNSHLAKVFYDLKLMEKEGSGYDKIYAILLSAAKPIPIVQEGNDRVSVIIKKRIANKDIINFIDKANTDFQLKIKELITLGLIAQSNALTAIELSKTLGLNEDSDVQHWIGKLVDLGLVQTNGKTKGTTYFVNAEFLKKYDFKGKTNLKRIETHRLKELIRHDLSIYTESSIGQIHQRIGIEIPLRSVRVQLDNLVIDGIVEKKGQKKGTKYIIVT